MSIEYEEIFNHVLPALQSKRNEFIFYRYDSVTEKDIWNYCVKKKWRKKIVNEIPLHEIINGIMETTPSAYIAHSQVEEFRTANFFSDLNQEELQILLQPTKEKKNHDQ